MINIEDLPKQEQETILREIREWETQSHINEITEEDLEKMAEEICQTLFTDEERPPLEEWEIQKMRKEENWGEI